VLDVLLQGLQALVSLFILLSFVYPCINIIKYITTEKEKQLKEAMKIMGLDSWLHWTAWFAKCFIYMFITVTLMTVLMKIRWYGESNPNAVFTYGSATVLWFFLLIYSVTTIMFCFMLSVFFSKASTASAVAGLVWFLIYSPYSFIQQRYDSVSLGAKLFLSLFSNTGMALGFNVIMRYEGTQEGIQWHNIFKPVSIDDSFHLGYVLIMLIIDGILYLLIALYVEKIFPGDYGVSEKWYFPFTSKFWFSIPDYVGVSDVNVNNNGVHQINANYETEPKNKTAGIRIENLRKVFDNDKVAVEGLNLKMYEDQITVLLGANGAGKTTTMSMITGMIEPTSGTAIVNGKDIRKDMNSIRSSIGFCPQHNILFEDLTVREHITFFSLLKGLHKDDVNREVEKYVKLLKLENKIDVQARGLSGGMKRKLSVGIALCANSKIVLFDEPSSGVDPGKFFIHSFLCLKIAFILCI
jgi:ATP-binding cassette, subfamily A (ABC1), member 3